MNIVRKGRATVFGTAAILFALVLGLNAPSQAANIDPGKDTVSEAIAAQAKDLGFANGQEVETLMSWQNNVAQMLTEIQDRRPDEIAYTRMTNDGATVGFRAHPSAETEDLLATVKVPVTFVTDVGWSEREAASVGEAAHYAVYNALGGAEVATDTDAETGAVNVFVAPEDIAEARIALESVEAKIALEKAPGIQVQVQTDPNLASGNDALVGGSSMSGGLCTSGFSVKTASYAHGMMTADHCPNSLSMGSYALSYRGGSSTRDVQWHSTTATTTVNKLSTTHNITATANPTVGQLLCRYGVTSGLKCDYTYKANQCRNTYCGMMTMEKRLAAGGDSGGPWFSSTTAYGVHSGWVTIWLVARDMFTPVRNGASTLGVTVKIS
ncbi:S1 family peptidase [Jonesiaceae bacterium BS-20]|uniref:S1 family peptidase n=1 Tax=Jonesiaceae bacterium BS-20 TaxID=3120821 RepID=A0AAU7E0D8_9MICO